MANPTSSSIDDQQERHFIGDLLCEEDVFGQPNTNPIEANTCSQLSGGSVLPSVGPLGPPPNQAFWPEPPPPYSPYTVSPPQWPSINHQPAGLFGPPVANIFGQPPTATAVTRTDFYQAPFNGPNEWDPVTGAPIDSYPMVGSGIPFNPHTAIPMLKPMIPGGGAVNTVQHHYHNMYHHHNIVSNHFAPPNVISVGGSNISSGYSNMEPTSVIHVETHPQRRISTRNPKKVGTAPVQYMKEDSAPNSPTSPTVPCGGKIPPGGKSYRDVASNKQHVGSDTSATSIVTISSAPVRHASSSSSGGNGTPIINARRIAAVHRNIAVRHSSGDSLVEGSVNASNTTEKGIVGLNPIEKTAGAPSKRTGENEFQKITHKKSKGGKGGKNEQIITDEDGIAGNQAVDASSRFDVLQSLGGQSANIATHETSHISQRSLPPGVVQQDANRLAKTLKDTTGFGGRSAKDVVDSHETYAEDVDEEMRITKEIAKQSGVLQRSGSKCAKTRTILLGTRRELSDQNLVDAQRSGGRKQRGSAKKRQSTAVDFLNFILLAVFSLLKRATQWILDLIIDISLQLRDIAVYATLSTYTNVTYGCQRLWYSSLDKLRSFWNSVCAFSVRKLWANEECEDGDWGLNENIQLPITGEEAMDRLLRCHGRDAYAVLGLRADCSDEDIKRYYKRQAVLVHPDKNHWNGADEAFKILSTAFEAIGTPEARLKYNMANLRKNPLHKEMEELWERLREKMNEARNTMHCDCGSRHTRVVVEGRRPQEARYCKKCRIRHPAKHNDIWAETRFGGLWWVYYTCLDGIIYDITQWAACPNNRLKHMKANSHVVQYRLVSKIGPPSLNKGDNTVRRGKKSHQQQPEMNDFDYLDGSCGGGTINNGCGYSFPLGCVDGSTASQQASYRPPERRSLDGDRPRRAGRRRKLR